MTRVLRYSLRCPECGHTAVEAATSRRQALAENKEQTRDAFAAFWFARERLKQENKAPHLNPVPNQHLFSYLNLSDLRIVLQQFRELFLSKLTNKDKKVFEAALFGLEDIRNMVAHNRKVSPEDLDHLERSARTIRRTITQSEKGCAPGQVPSGRK